ncbi:MAG: DUF177 domain-containing protein [Vicinamibacterales bacterium]
MTLDLTAIRQPETAVEREFPPDAIGGDDGFRVIAPARLAATLHKDKDRYRLAGSVSTRLEVPCSRCLEPFSVPVDGRFDFRYLPQALAGDRDEDREHDPATTFYRDETIDLVDLVREQCYLALPMKPLCRPDCQGLCPTCGVNLNLERCSCETRWVDPRFAGLQSLVSPRTDDDA